VGISAGPSGAGRVLLRLAANPLAKERWAALDDYAPTRAKGEKLHRFTIRERDRSKVEADPPAGLERFVEQVLEHDEVLLGDRPGEPKKDIAWSLESGFDSQHGREELQQPCQEFVPHLRIPCARKSRPIVKIHDGS
jgi:hypothetical protein